MTETPQDVAARAAREAHQSAFDNLLPAAKRHAVIDRAILLARLHERMVEREKGHAAHCRCCESSSGYRTRYIGVPWCGGPCQREGLHTDPRIDPNCQSLRDAAKREFEEAANGPERS